jgi:hypothetical protein
MGTGKNDSVENTGQASRVMYHTMKLGGSGAMTFLLFSFLFYFVWSCDDKNSNIIGPYKVIPKLNYYQPKVECIKAVEDQIREKVNVRNLNITCDSGFILSTCYLKDIIKLANNLRIDYLKRYRNPQEKYSFYDSYKFGFNENEIDTTTKIDYCVYDRIYFDISDKIFQIHKVSKSVMHPDLEIYPFFYNEFTICYCRRNEICNDTKRGIVDTVNFDSSDVFIFIDKVNKLKLCFKPESSGRGYSDPNPLLHPGVYILDDSFYPICLMSFSYGDLSTEGCEHGYIPLVLFRIDYFENARYVKGYTQLNYSRLNKGMLFYKNLKYKTLADFINVMKRNMKLLFVKDNINNDDLVRFWKQSCFPPTPEWCDK